MHRRFISRESQPVEIRADDGQPARIAGYAAVYYNGADPGTEYELFRYGNYSAVERLMPGCFDRAAREDDVRALFNHAPDNVLGRCKAGTLRLSVDATGLRYEIDAPDTQTARDLMESLKRGDVSGSSFSFDYLKKNIVAQQDGDAERDIVEVHDVRLYDVGPVTFPAYSSTTAGARSADVETIKRELELLRGERLRNPAAKRARARMLELE